MAGTNYKGFDLFTDIEDAQLRTRNRAVVLANMAQDHSKDRRISPKGAGLILGYFSEIPKEERKEVKDEFVIKMKERGYVLVG